MATTSLGLSFLEDRNVLEGIVNNAYNSPVMSVRATAFYCLSLFAVTEEGSSSLAKFGKLPYNFRKKTRFSVTLIDRCKTGG